MTLAHRAVPAALLAACLGASGCDIADRVKSLFNGPRNDATATAPPSQQSAAPHQTPDAPPPAPTPAPAPAPDPTPAPLNLPPPAPLDLPPTPNAVPVHPNTQQPLKPPMGAKAVVIGDSHTAGAAYSAVLHAALEASYPGQVAYYGVCSATAEWWLTAPGSRNNTNKCFLAAGPGQPVHAPTTTPKALPSVEELLAAKPELIIVALGTNQDGSPDKAIQEFGARLGATEKNLRCLWVGPPPLPTGRDQYLAKFYKLLQENIGGRCRVLDSRTVMAGRPPSKPGDFHYAGAHAEHWAKAVVKEAAAK